MSSSPVDLSLLEVVTISNHEYILCKPCQYILGLCHNAPLPLTTPIVPFTDAGNLLRFHLQRVHHFTHYPSLVHALTDRPDLRDVLHNGRTRRPPPLPDHLPRFPTLPLVAGFQCNRCPGSNRCRTSSYERLTQHLNTEYAGLDPLPFCSAPRTTGYTQVHLQHWGGSSQGSWWVVDPTGLPPIPPRHPISTKKETPSSPPESRLAVEPSAHDLYSNEALAGTQAQDEWNLVVKRARWHKIFAKLPYWRALRRLTYVPHSQAYQCHDPQAMGSELEEALFSAEQESILQVVLDAQGRIYQRYRATLETTPEIVRKWIHSSSAGRRSIRPLEWKGTSHGSHQYCDMWKRLLCLLFRVYQLPPRDVSDIEVTLSDLWRHLTPTQRELTTSVWDLAVAHFERRRRRGWTPDHDESLPQGKGSTRDRQLEEKLMELNWSLIQRPTDLWSAANRCVLLYFAGVLSFNLRERYGS
jgi:hypothetical protein